MRALPYIRAGVLNDDLFNFIRAEYFYAGPAIFRCAVGETDIFIPGGNPNAVNNLALTFQMLRTHPFSVFFMPTGRFSAGLNNVINTDAFGRRGAYR